MSEDNDARFSRRKLLGSVATVGAASALGGAATSALLWDEEKFGDADNPNVLQGGSLDLAVDWEVRYYNGIGTEPTQEAFQALNKTSAGPNGPNDQPGPIINLQDVKPGDIVETTLSAHVFGNPAFLSMHYQEHLDRDNGITEPEDKEDGHSPDQSDRTDGDGDLDEAMQVVIWYDDGNNLPGEVWPAAETTDGGSTVLDVDTVQNTQDATTVVNGDEIYAGTLGGLGVSTRHTLDARDSVSVAGPPTDFSNSQCYPNSNDEYIGVLAWVPRDIPGMNDNIIQTDKLEFQFGFDAIQCRHNVGPNGTAIDGTINASDAENNALSPGGNGT